MPPKPSFAAARAAFLSALLAAGAAAAPAPAAAQLSALRTSTAAPLDVQPGRRFPAPSFAGDLARGYGSTNDARAWNVTLRGLVQLRTRSGRTALVGEVANEMTANPYNSGGLNPRGTTWEENVRVVRRVGAVAVHAGVFFRSRHEVDGATPIDDRPGAPPEEPSGRVVANKGVEVGGVSRPLAVGRRVRARFAASADWFTAREDWRVPYTTAGPNWARSRGRVAGSLRLSAAAARWVEPYARAWASTTFFDADGGGTPGRGTGTRVEVGARLGQSAGLVDVFVVRERLFDDLAHPTPVGSRVLGVGARLGSGAFF